MTGADAADVEADRGVETECPSAGGGFGGAEHDADFHAELVDEDDGGAGAVGGAAQLAEGSAHEPRLEPDVRVAHVAIELGLRDQGGDGVDDHEIDRAALDEDFGDVERLFAAVGLADEELFRVDAEVLRVVHVEGVLGVDERGGATLGLALGDGVEGERRLAAGLGAVDFDDAALWVAAATQGFVEGRAAGRDARDALGLAIAETHHGALAELFFDVLKDGVYGFEGLFHRCWLLRLGSCGRARLGGLPIENSVLEGFGGVGRQHFISGFERGDGVRDA